MTMRMMPILVLLALTAGWLSAIPVQEQRFGKISNIEFTRIKPELEWNTTKFGPAPELGDDETFAIITLFLAEGRSIGLYDYKLAGRPALAISIGAGAFNPDNWQVTFEQCSGREVRVLYRIADPGEPERLEWTLTFNVPSIPPAKRSGFLLLVEAPAAIPGAGRLNLNTATAAELQTLPGITAELATAILSRREAEGPFASVDDLAAVEGLDAEKITAIRDLVDVEDAGPPVVALPLDEPVVSPDEPAPTVAPTVEPEPDPEPTTEPEAKPEPKPEPDPRPGPVRPPTPAW